MDTQESSRMSQRGAVRASSAIQFTAEDRREITEAVDAILASGRLTLGPHTEAFENDFSRVAGTRHAVAVNGGTAALEIILRGIGVRGGSVVIPANTFVATATAVIRAGATPIFADIDESLCLDAASLGGVAGSDLRAVVVVHIGGGVAPQIDEISSFCRRRGIPLVEDAAHAHGSTWRSRPAGSLSHAAAFSFYPTKVVTAGEGGMVVTDDADLAAFARKVRDQGKETFEGTTVVHEGFNWRLPEVSAAIGRISLRRLDEFIAGRRSVAELYDASLREVLDVRPNDRPAHAGSNFYKFIALLPEGLRRAELKADLEARYGVRLAGEVYDVPCYRQPAIVEAGFAPAERLTTAEDLCARHICPPLFPGADLGPAPSVIDALRGFLGGRV